MYFDQSEFEIRFEWGLAGLQHLLPISDVIILIDLLSFTTCVDLALSRGAQVYPFAWKDERLTNFAHHARAIPAIASRTDPNGFSLAPTSMLRLPQGSSIVLPSPNGSALSLATGATPTFAACLRNAQAVAQAAIQIGQRISVIAAGERWPDQSLRPALEDLIGSGAVIQSLSGSRSPESEMALAVFNHFLPDLPGALRQCGSGKEAAQRGTPEDVHLASELNVSASAPRLFTNVYRPG